MKDQYLEVLVDNEKLEVDTEQTPVSISFILEDGEDFQTKKGSEALDIETSLNLNNSKLTNTLSSLSARDMSPGNVYENPRIGVIRAHGYELLTGKALLKSIKRKLTPTSATWHFYGDNSDWAIDLKDKTLDLFVNQNSFAYTFATVINSWNFDGRNSAFDYVFAPVRYSNPFGSSSQDWEGKDQVVTIYDLKPALSIYWIIYRAFNSIGYTIKSNFFDLDYFRRLVMPWTFGNFLLLNETIYDNYKFSANTPETERTSGDCNLWHRDLNAYIDLKVTNDSSEGMYDNGGSPGNYQAIDGTNRWTYPSTATSKIIAGLSASVFINWFVNWGSYIELHAHWFLNGTLIKDEKIWRVAASDAGGRDQAVGEYSTTFETEVLPGDVIDLRWHIDMKDTDVGVADASQYVSEFKLAYFKFSLNSYVELKNYNKFKSYKFLDLFRGIIDAFNLVFRTDSRRKVVTIEPLHPYSITSDLSATSNGYLSFDPRDWTDKQDVSKESELELYSDAEREWHFKFKDDGGDGGLKKMQDRYQITLSLGKYILPERFSQNEIKEVENRFFSPLMHMQALMFSSVTGITPQIPCIVPENISNTSATESDNTFEPKLAYYKGNITGVGGWKFLDENNQVVSYNTLPFMFAVNYQPGGHNDPILSYCNQKIGSDTYGYQIGYGLLRRFYTQRMAIYRHGRKFKTYFRLGTSDMVGVSFRNTIKLGGDQWILTEITNYQPLTDDSTETTLWRYMPIEQKDLDNIYPAFNSVMNDTIVANSPFDFKYVKQIILYSDLPK